jgi:hypothetical protein
MSTKEHEMDTNDDRRRRTMTGDDGGGNHGDTEDGDGDGRRR